MGTRRGFTPSITSGERRRQARSLQIKPDATPRYSGTLLLGASLLSAWGALDRFLIAYCDYIVWKVRLWRYSRPGSALTGKEPANRLAEVEYGLKRRGY